MRYRYRKYLALLIVLSIIGIILFFPLKVQFNFRSNSWINPVKKWSLRSDLEGNFYSELQNFSTGAIEKSTSYRFDRSDIATLKLSDGMANNAGVGAGDTVGWLYSRLVEERISQLENLLEVQKKLLESNVAGEKSEIIENLRQKKLLAEQQYDYARKNYLRSEALFRDSVITAFEFDIDETAFQTAKTNVDIAKSDYEIAVTGVKPEEIKLIEQQILAYENELEFLNETRKTYLLTSPINGKLVFNHHLPEQMEYVAVSDTSGYMLYVPVKIQYRLYLRKNMEIEVIIPGSSERLQARITDISDKVDNILTNMVAYQVVFVKAEILNNSPLIVPGLSVQSIFKGEKITLREYIARTINIYFS